MAKALREIIRVFDFINDDREVRDRAFRCIKISFDENYDSKKRHGLLINIFLLSFQNSERIFVGAPGSWYWQGKTSSSQILARERDERFLSQDN